MPQCQFVRKGYAVDPNDFEIYHNYNCVKPEGHAGKHSFHTNPSKFFKHWRSAKDEQQRILKRMEVIINRSKDVRV